MATAKENEERIAQLEELLRRFGVAEPAGDSDDPTMWPDYIEFGSDEHLAFLGLVKLNKADAEIDRAAGLDTFEGTKGTYRLVDPIGPYGGYNDPRQAANMALRQKVAVFEMGRPTVHEKAPEMWYPEDQMPELARMMRGR